jgi:hypothetical protein
LYLEGLKDPSTLADLSVDGTVSGLTRPDVALTRSGVVNHLTTLADRPSLRSLPDTDIGSTGKHRRWRRAAYRISGLEQDAITQHVMHNDGKAAGKRNPGFPEAAPLCDLQLT